MSTTNKPVNQKAWFLVLPVIVCVAFSAILPLMTVVNYSVQDVLSPDRRVFVGTEWFAAVMRDEELHLALWRQIQFSLAVLLVEQKVDDALRFAPRAVVLERGEVVHQSESAALSQRQDLLERYVGVAGAH